MAKSNLRELFQKYNDPLICYSMWVYDLLEALVNELEAQRPPEVDARIVKLREECNYYQKLANQLRDERDKAKTEIKRLRGWWDWWANYLGDHQPNEDWAEELKANAALGRLVRGMQVLTALRRYKEGKFGIARCRVGVGWSCDLTFFGVNDPAEALRAIQQENDKMTWNS